MLDQPEPSIGASHVLGGLPSCTYSMHPKYYHLITSEKKFTNLSSNLHQQKTWQCGLVPPEAGFPSSQLSLFVLIPTSDHILVLENTWILSRSSKKWANIQVRELPEYEEGTYNTETRENA